VLQKFSDYLSSIGITERAYIDRVEACLNAMNIVAPTPITDLIVEDIIQEDGTRQYLHLVGIAGSFLVSFNFFLTAEKVSVHALSRGVVRLSATTTNYDYTAAKPESRILVDFVIGGEPEGGWQLQASGANVDAVWEFTKSHLRTQMKP